MGIHALLILSWVFKIAFLHDRSIADTLVRRPPEFGDSLQPSSLQRVDHWKACAAAGKQVLAYKSGHRNNIFQARLLPNTSNSTVVTCAADGQARAYPPSTHWPFATQRCLSLKRIVNCHSEG